MSQRLIFVTSTYPTSRKSHKGHDKIGPVDFYYCTNLNLAVAQEGQKRPKGNF